MPQILPMNIPFILLTLMISFVSMMLLNEMSWKNSSKKKTHNKTKKKSHFFLSLFLSFDPKTSTYMEMNWIVLILIMAFMLLSFWKKPTRMNIILKELTNEISKQFKIALKTNKDSSNSIFISIFLMILCVNMMGLFPNIFTPTSHISMNMMLSFPLWMGFMAFGWTKFTNKMLSHLVPNGTPTPLISFMVLIEMISNFIRSLTLSIRLMANMVSGHLLLTLMGNLMESSSTILILILTFVQGILTSLELGVAFIQAYVFCMLLTLYSNDSDFN